MRPQLGDAAVLQHGYLVRPGYGREPVGDRDDRPVARELVHRLDDGRLVLGVECRRRLVEEDYGRVLQEGPGDGDALALATGESYNFV